MKPNYLYLDNAATSKPSKAVFKAMQPFLLDQYGNPSSLHKIGLNAKNALSKAREEVANILGCRPTEIIFTSGGTESVNLAIFGTARQYQLNHKKPGHIIVSSIEHEAVLESVKALKEEGWKIDFLPVDKTGLVDYSKLNNLIKKDTVLVSVMHANNEVGTIQPLIKISHQISEFNQKRSKDSRTPILFHTDACQSAGIFDINVQKLRVDLLTLNGSKLNGPKGSGLLYKRQGVKLRPIIFGGGQEFGLRSGTENLASIIGLATALTERTKLKTVKAKKLFKLQQHLEKSLSTRIPGLTINGPINHRFDPEKVNYNLNKLPGTISFSIKGIEAEALMLYMDSNGFAIATGSACSSQSTDPSHVLIAMGLNSDQANSTVRLSLGDDLTNKDMEKFVKELEKTIKILRSTEHSL